MRQASTDFGQGENTFPVAGDDSTVNIVARVRRRLFLWSKDGLPVQPTTMVTRSVHFVEARFDQQITLDDMAAAAGISKFYFCREFKVRTGLSPGVFLRGYRVVRAMDNLLNSTELIGNIAADAGYHNPAVFSRAFRKVTGCTPYLFRMTHHTRAKESGLRSA
jgi:AraC-like DNA-binding protein